jgi:hypothetical protein
MSLPDMFNAIGDASFYNMDELSSQPDGSRRNGDMNQVQKYLGKDKKHIYEGLKRMTDHIDNIALPKILAKLSRISK